MCAGHGRCRDGVSGDGRCECDAGAGAGHWAGAACTECAAGYYNADCTGLCPMAAGSGAVCSGHGVCDEGVAGAGACSCGTGYVGQDCAVACPVGTDGAPCGHGYTCGCSL